jgi:ribosomal-protein-serine acetyltransferase
MFDPASKSVEPSPDSSWLQSTPPETLSAGTATLVKVTEKDIPEIVVAVNETLDDLRLWMPWAQQAATQESIAAFVSEASTRWESGLEFQYVIRHQNEVAGCCGLLTRMGPGTLETGYWVRKKFQRRGIATSAAKVLTGVALKMAEVERVAIRCDPENERSACVAAKLGFHLHGIYDRSPDLPGAPGHQERLMVWLTSKR